MRTLQREQKLDSSRRIDEYACGARAAQPTTPRKLSLGRAAQYGGKGDVLGQRYLGASTVGRSFKSLH